MRRAAYLLLSCLFFTHLAFAQEHPALESYKAVVDVNFKAGSNSLQVSGVVINDNTLITADIAQRVDEASGSWTDGAQSAALTHLLTDAENGISLWKSDVPFPNKIVFAARTISEQPPNGTDLGFIAAGERVTHAGTQSALERFTSAEEVPFSAYGGGVYNDCKELAGISVAGPDFKYRDIISAAPIGTNIHVLSSDKITPILETAGESYTRATVRCTEDVARARSLVEEKASNRDALQAKADEAEARAQELEKEAEALRSDADQSKEDKKAAEAAAEKAEAEAKSAREAAQKAKEDANLAEDDRVLAQKALDEIIADLAKLEEEAQNWQSMAIAAAIIGAIIACFAIWFFGRSRSATKHARHLQDEANRTRPTKDLLLEGEDNSHLLSGKLLPDAVNGVIIGRHPKHAQVVLDADDVSRRHARIFEAGNTLYIEDLGSSYGTTVNGAPLAAQTAYVLELGDTIEFAQTRFKLRKVPG